MDKHKVSLTQITSSQPKVLTKQCSLDNAGTMHCKASANMYMGEAQQVQVTTANDFANLLQSLSDNQALCYGVAHVSNIRMLSLTEYEKQGKPADAITRTKDMMHWPTGGGVLMLDYDPQDGRPALSKVQLLKTLTEVMPELEVSAYVWWLSSSSLIYNDQEQLHGIRGQRVYILVQDASDIPRAGAVLFNKLWLAGHGFYMISRAGTALERTIIDASVWQTNRLDFAAGAQCTPPLEQRKRPVLALAPAIGLDAPVQGTGKTYLAQCLGILATGEDVPASPPVKGRDDEEVRKRLASMLMTDSRVILWDNILGHFDSASMASLITTETYTDRILGKSEQSTLINRALVLLTGNNLTLAGDMPRRVLKCRLDAQIANPTLRVFKGDPKAFIKQNRVKLVQAGLTIIKAYLSSPECLLAGGAVKGGANGFAEWDKLVRQPVAWIAQTIGAGEYEDPAEALKEAIANDPELETLALALEGIKGLMGEEWFETGELYNRIERTSFTMIEDQGKPSELKEVLEDLTGSNRLTTRGLGRVLGYRVDRIANGLKLTKRTGGRVARFRVEAVVETEQVQQIA